MTRIGRFLTAWPLLFALSACGKESAPPPVGSPSLPPSKSASPIARTAIARANTPGTAAVIAAVDLDEVERAPKPYRLALVGKTRNNPFVDPMIKAFEAACKELGVTGQNHATAEARGRGFEAVGKGIDVVAHESANGKMEEANAKALIVLAANPELKGIYCASDRMALGVLKSIQQAGKACKVFLIGNENIPAV